MKQFYRKILEKIDKMSLKEIKPERRIKNNIETLNEVIIEKNSEKQIEIETIIMSKEGGIKKIIIKKVFEEKFAWLSG